MILMQLPILVGQILHRLGKLNALEISDEAFTARIAEDQIRRTQERKAAQIVRAEKAKTRKTRKAKKKKMEEPKDDRAAD